MDTNALKSPLHGWLILDKPVSLGSTPALGRVKRLLRPLKAGHGGTLDPLASGVLPIALGEATKTVDYIMDTVKTYQFTVQWGQARDTDDAEGKVVETSDYRPLEHDIQGVLPSFTGDIFQIPPAFSALKVDGDRSYDLARSGHTVVHPPRPVHIDSLRLLSCVDINHASFEVVCGKGTYVRSLARDIARALGTVGYVTKLRRLRVGPFDIGKAATLETLEEKPLAERRAYVHSIESVFAHQPCVTLTDDEARRLRQGQKIPLTAAHIWPAGVATVLALYHGIAVGFVQRHDEYIIARRLFNF